MLIDVKKKERAFNLSECCAKVPLFPLLSDTPGYPPKGLKLAQF
jgi:hypothetical protein